MSKRRKTNVNGISEGAMSIRIGRTKTGYKFIEAYNLSGRFSFCDFDLGDWVLEDIKEYSNITDMKTVAKMLSDAVSKPIIDLRKYD